MKRHLEISILDFFKTPFMGKCQKKNFLKKIQGAFCFGRNKEEFSAQIFQALDTDKMDILTSGKSSKPKE